ncbi:hypothetical protein GEMRC1_013272 [Eukaryota sp. GEM-RC1]
MVKFPSNLYLPRLLDYMATEISTSYKNNMAKHFHSYVFRVFNLVTEKKSRALKIECEDERKLFFQRLNSIRELIVNGQIDLIDFQDQTIFPTNSRLTIAFRTYLTCQLNKKLPKGLYYAQKVNPLKFLSHAIYLNRLIEEFCDNVSVTNPFPVTSSLIPGHVRLDSNWFQLRFLPDLKGEMEYCS